MILILHLKRVFVLKNNRNRFSVWNENGQSEHSIDLQTHSKLNRFCLSVFILLIISLFLSSWKTNTRT